MRRFVVVAGAVVIGLTLVVVLFSPERPAFDSLPTTVDNQQAVDNQRAQSIAQARQEVLQAQARAESEAVTLDEAEASLAAGSPSEQGGLENEVTAARNGLASAQQEAQEAEDRVAAVSQVASAPADPEVEAEALRAASADLAAQLDFARREARAEFEQGRQRLLIGAGLAALLSGLLAVAVPRHGRPAPAARRPLAPAVDDLDALTSRAEAIVTAARARQDESTDAEVGRATVVVAEAQLDGLRRADKR